MLKGNIHEASLVFWGQFFDRSFQKKVEMATSDQFPFRFPLIHLSKAIDRKLIKLSYSPLADPAFPADMKSGYFITHDESRLIPGVNVYNEDVKKIIRDRIQNYQVLINEHPNQHFYIFYHQLWEDSKYHPLNRFFSGADQGQSIEYFKQNKPDGLILGMMMFSSLEDFEDSYYKTDRHWNNQGIFKAYDGIYTLLSQNYPDISPPLSHQVIENFPDIEFLGSMARNTLYPIKGDQFEVAKYNLPPYTILRNGVRVQNGKSSEYLRGEYSTNDYINHYSLYYGGDARILEYIFENNSKRNLLLLGNSFNNPLKPLLAYHYHHLYSIDLRHTKTFSLSEFLSTHPVDDILIIADHEVLFDKNFNINP